MMKNAMPQRLFFLLFILLQAVVMGLMSGQLFFAGVAGTIAIAGLPGFIQLNITGKRLRNLFIFIAILFLIKSQIVSTDLFPGRRAILLYAYSYAIAQFLLVFQIVYLFLKMGKRFLPPYVPLAGIFAMLYLGDKFSNPTESFFYRWLALSSIILIGLYITACIPYRESPQSRRLDWFRTIALLIVSTMVIGLGWLGGQMIIESEPFAAKLLSIVRIEERYSGSTSAGFNAEGRFESVSQWKRSGADEVALRIYSPQCPGYLRGKAFNVFDFRQLSGWTNTFESKSVDPSLVLAGVVVDSDRDNFFDIQQDSPNPGNQAVASSEWTVMDVRPVASLRDVLFSTLGTRLLEARLQIIQLNEAGVPETTVHPSNNHYSLFTLIGSRKESLSAAQKSRYTELQEVDPRIEEIARNVFAKCHSTRDKMVTVESYFHRNYKYQLTTLSSHVPQGSNLMTYFLLNRPAGHCEYFASGAAILLRLSGVPCRYVTGFVANERNKFGGYWTAKNQDAHAWVEAYDEVDQEWHIVDATPAEGIPGMDSKPEAGWHQFWDSIRFYLARVRSALTGEGLKDLLNMLLRKSVSFLRFLFTWPGVMALLVVIAAAITVIVALDSRRRQRIYQSSQVADVNRLLNEMDRRILKYGFRREPDETLDHFSERLHEMQDLPDGAGSAAGKQFLDDAALWYSRYAAIRYGQPLTEEIIETLRAQLPRKTKV